MPVGRLIVSDMKIQSVNFEAIDSERVKVLGDLNLHTVSAYLDEGKSIISNAQSRLCMDLSNIQVEDTSVLALLISWHRFAISQDKHLLIANCPHKLLEIAKLGGIHEILSFEI